ncbi:hypothetical protein FJZ22_02975 [Candidatus Pacearchaeota archaeon]|nr:hypothetical protein [Candidatus Pacearchaeota archaeon]
MGSLDVLPYPFPESGRYVSAPHLTLRERLSEINARVVLYPDDRVNREATYAWRAEGIRELPLPPAGQGYFFNKETHKVELRAEEGYVHHRRKVDTRSLESHPRSQAKLEAAQQLAEKREMQAAIRATEKQILTNRRASSSRR